MKKSPPPGGTLRFGWQGIICSSVFIFLQDVHCSAEPPLSANPAPVFIPRLNCPVYVMEYHIWYRSPFGREHSQDMCIGVIRCILFSAFV